jgi:SHS2 domain-containing protein
MYRWVEHTGELELEIFAPDEAGVFGGAVAALNELLQNGPQDRTVSHDLDAKASDRGALLANFIEEVLFRVETEDFIPAALSSLELQPEKLHARIEGHRGRPSHLVKAVTFHRLAFERSDSGWQARVVLDV